MTEPFIFGIALTPRDTARDWDLVQRLLGLTLASVQAQTDPDWRVVVVGHDRPAGLDDRRYDWLQADWPVEPPGPHNDDSGRKKHLINDRLLAEGGGLLMLLDADDWVDRRTVEVARRCVVGECVGGLIESGWAIDPVARRAAALPDPRLFDGGFHRLCGSSTVAWLRPDAPEPGRRDPFTVLRSHHQWIEAASAAGLALARLPLEGGYLVNTGENHSDLHGPHLDWRRGFVRAVHAHGRALDDALTGRFGLTAAEVSRAMAG